MTLNEMIDALLTIRGDHDGDLECVDENGVPLAFPEYNDDDEPCVVMCEKR